MTFDDVKCLVDKEYMMELIKANIGPRTLEKKLKDKYSKSISVHLIKKYAEEVLNKKWEDKKWGNFKEGVIPQLPLLELLEEISERSENQTENTSDENQSLHVNNPIGDSKDIKTCSTVINHLETVLKKLNQIESNISDMKNRMNNFYKDYNHLNNELKITSQKVIDIYGSDGIKTSYNINKKLKDELRDTLGKSYGIEKNDSKLINLAMLVALLYGKKE